MMQVTKVWWDGEKLMAEPIDPASVYKEDSTCNKTLIAQGKANPRTCKKCGLGPCIADRVQPAQQELTNIERHERNVQKFLGEQPAQQEPVACFKVEYEYPTAQRTWVGLTDDERAAIGREMAKTLPNRWIDFDYARAVEAKLKEKNT